MREADLHKSCAKWLRGSDYIVIKLTTLGRYGMAGLPDLLILDRGAYVRFVELKLPGKELTPLQARWHKKLNDFGFTVYVVHSLAELQEIF